MRDTKRTEKSRVQTVSVRTIRRNRQTEQSYTDRQYARLLKMGL